MSGGVARAASRPSRLAPAAEPDRLLRTLALPTFGLALAISVLTTYAPVLLRQMTSSRTAVGFAIGGEGVFALFLPLLVGSLSNRLPCTRFGKRLPFALAAAPLLALALVLFPYAGSFWLAVGVIFAFYVGYFVYYPPYQALYADLVPSSHSGRAQAGRASRAGSASARRSWAAACC